MQDVMIIGIAGGSGSGKTTLAQKIKDVFEDKVSILCHDYYYKSNDNISMEERKKLKDSLEHKEKGLHNMKENEGEPITNVTLGMEAFLPSLNQTVVIISMPDHRGDVQVEAGIMKINVKLKDLRKTKVTKQEKVKKKREVKLNLSNIESRVDLRGMDSEEACYKTDKYLDDAYRANLGEVTIVHGKGTGVLRNAITAMLKRHPHVKSFRLGVYGEGGDGVTVVELKA
ncbi:MAG: Smr/MutS family protein [Clostridium sp.]|nr:Smr/MutS family protein [Clostridium sp.]